MSTKEAMKNLKEIISLTKEEIEKNNENVSATLDYIDLKSLKILIEVVENSISKDKIKGLKEFYIVECKNNKLDLIPLENLIKNINLLLKKGE